MGKGWLLVELFQEVGKPRELVSRQSADVEFHARALLHRDIRYTILSSKDGKLRVRQEARVAGLVHRDEFVQTVLDDGTVVQEVVAGANRGGRITLAHDALGPESARIRARLEVPLAGFKRLLKPVLAWGILKAAQQALAEECAALESGRYEAYLSTIQSVT